MTQILRLPQLAWHGVRDLELAAPDNWQIEICNMAGHGRPVLTEANIRHSIRNPLGTAPIRELATKKTQAVIIFDDMQRATRLSGIVPHILEELAEGGIHDSNIRFIAALGCHAPMNRQDFVKKLGENVVRRYPVFNHNAFGSCIYTGTTSFGTKLFVNAEVMHCDLKIALGSIVPHALAGFGGGAKQILPGICSYDTCVEFHKLGGIFKKEHPEMLIGMGIMENNLLRQNMEEAAGIIGLDVKVDLVMNAYGENVAIYTGSLKDAYTEAIKDAQANYNTKQPKDQDIVIANAFAKAAECESGLEIAFPSVRKDGGDMILIGNVPEGHVVHYLAGPWGTLRQNPYQMQCLLSPAIEQLYIYSEYPDLTLPYCFSEPERIVLIPDWQALLKIINARHEGPIRVAVYPSADIQYCASAPGTGYLSFKEG